MKAWCVSSCMASASSARSSAWRTVCCGCPTCLVIPVALPQIMKKSGIDYFMTTKLSWNQFNKVPNDTMMWEGIDGSRVLTHFISTLGVGQSVEKILHNL